MKHLQRFVRAGTSAEVAVLAVMTLFMGAACLLVAARPFAPDSPRVVLLSVGVVSLVGTVALVRAGSWLSPARLHVAIVVFTLLRSLLVAVAVSERGLLLSALGFAWTAVYVAFFFPPAVARRYAALMTVSLGLSLLVSPAAVGVSVWIAISLMVWVSIAVLTQINARLRAEAHADSLTGLLNRTGFALAAARQRAMSARRGEPVAVAVIDLDDFKLVNDRDGHAAGDRLLVELAGVWTALLRPGDLLARFGGDEFVLMLPGAERDQVDALLHRLARAHPAAWTAGAVPCEDDESLDSAIERADARLYAAKQSRRAAAGRRPAAWSWQPSPA
jgi:diguanylate cyclase (GGDEF)-like protein